MWYYDLCLLGEMLKRNTCFKLGPFRRELSHCTMDMFLHTFEGTFTTTQMLESQQRLSKSWKMGFFGKIRTFFTENSWDMKIVTYLCSPPMFPIPSKRPSPCMGAWPTLSPPYMHVYIFTITVRVYINTCLHVYIFSCLQSIPCWIEGVFKNGTRLVKSYLA